MGVHNAFGVARGTRGVDGGQNVRRPHLLRSSISEPAPLLARSRTGREIEALVARPRRGVAANEPYAAEERGFGQRQWGLLPVGQRWQRGTETSHRVLAEEP